MQSETGFPSSHQLKSYIASKYRLKVAARCPVSGCWPSCWPTATSQIMTTLTKFVKVVTIRLVAVVISADFGPKKRVSNASATCLHYLVMVTILT